MQYNTTQYAVLIKSESGKSDSFKRVRQSDIIAERYTVVLNERLMTKQWIYCILCLHGINCLCDLSVSDT